MYFTPWRYSLQWYINDANGIEVNTGGANLLVLSYNYKILLASGRFRALLINFVRTKRG